MQTEGFKIDEHINKDLGLYFKGGLSSDGSVFKGLSLCLSNMMRPNLAFLTIKNNII